ncbi:MAG: DUF3551 domain-containing protein [Xanthobacteraceae bacterium]
MRQIMFALAVAGGAAALALGGSSPAAARDYPYCLQEPGGVGIPGDCSYSTYEQCQMSASGRYAWCAINPRVAFAPQYQPDNVRPRRHPRRY